MPRLPSQYDRLVSRRDPSTFRIWPFAPARRIAHPADLADLAGRLVQRRRFGSRRAQDPYPPGRHILNPMHGGQAKPAAPGQASRSTRDPAVPAGRWKDDLHRGRLAMSVAGGHCL